MVPVQTSPTFARTILAPGRHDDTRGVRMGGIHELPSPALLVAQPPGLLFGVFILSVCRLWSPCVFCSRRFRFSSALIASCSQRLAACLSPSPPMPLPLPVPLPLPMPRSPLRECRPQSPAPPSAFACAPLLSPRFQQPRCLARVSPRSPMFLLSRVCVCLLAPQCRLSCVGHPRCLVR